MEELYAQRIKDLQATVVEKMKPEDVADKLCNLGCLTRKEKDTLLQVQGRGDQHTHNSMLIQLLLKKGPTNFVLEKFVGVLEDTANVSLANLLKHDISAEAGLSEVDKRILQKHHYDFVSGMETNAVLRILLDQHRYFTNFEKQDLHSKTTNKDRAEYLMSHVISKGSYRHLRLLKNALVDSGQDTLASYVPVSVKPPDQSDSEQTERGYISLILRVVKSASQVHSVSTRLMMELEDPNQQLYQRLLERYHFSELTAKQVPRETDQICVSMVFPRKGFVQRVRADINSEHLAKVVKECSSISKQSVWELEVEEEGQPRVHHLSYKEKPTEQSLLMNPEKPQTGDNDSGLPDSGYGSSGASVSQSVNSEGHSTSTSQSTGSSINKKPSEQEVDIARKVIFQVIDSKDFSPYDFWEKLIKYKKMNYITPKNLISDDGLNILQACIEKGRLSFLVHILHLGWWKILAGDKVSENSTLEHKGKSAKQIAESKKARKPLDEFNIHNEWEGSLSPLMRACRTGDVTKAKVLLENTALEIYHTDYNCSNALYWSVVAGKLDLVEYLEKQGLNIKMLTKKKENLLHLVCTLGHSHMVGSLVNTYKIDPTQIDTSHKTPLDRVAENGDINTLSAFVKCGIMPKPNSAALSAFAGRTLFLEHLFGLLEMSVNATDMYNRTALHRSCEAGKVSTVKYLLSKGADVTLVTSMGRNILHVLAENGNMDLLNQVLPLLKTRDILVTLLNVQDRYNGVDLCFLIRGRDKGRDAWHYVEVERYLVPIFLKKTKCGNVDVAKFGQVIKSGWGVNPDQDSVDDIEETFKYRRLNQNALKDQTPLHIAVAKGNYEIAKVLIEHGAALDIQDKFGLTPILLAASKGHLETVTLLENKGANFNVTTKQGFGMRDIADKNEHESIVHYSEGRDYTNLLNNFLNGPLKNVEDNMAQKKLRTLQKDEEDVKYHLSDTMRNVSSKVNDLLQKLNSGPVMKETVTYKSKQLVSTNNKDKVTTLVVGELGVTSLMSTGSLDSGYHGSLGSQFESLKTSSLQAVRV